MDHRFLIIGPGRISKKYVEIISKIKNAKVVGAVGRTTGKTERYAIEHGIEHFGIDIGQVAEKSKATAAVICTPNARHHEGVIEASNLGLHCICEKPLDIHPDEQNEMIRSCRKNKVKLAVSYQIRFRDSFSN